MTALHAYFALRNQQAFQRLLEASRQSASASAATSALSASGGKSWTKQNAFSSLPSGHLTCDVNERDWLGRCVLHLAVSSPDPAALEFVKLLLAHPRIDVNIADTESLWTPLHRALYAGNLAACILLLQRSDTDATLKDFEGYTAFDLYNSTVEGTKPDEKDLKDLFTWGTNRNASLGHGDGDNRAHPEQVNLGSQELCANQTGWTLMERFKSIRVRQVAMSKLHTVIVTDEKKRNVWVCGFGSGGRLGLGHNTQYSLCPLAQLHQRVTTVAVGQDHTLALTETGDVLSWGMNRFSQLGYVIEANSSGLPTGRTSNDEQIQVIPRRIHGPLKKEMVIGVAACRTASACWTEDDVFTWGMNNGQLGYEKTAQPAQVLPRKVTFITQGILDLVLTDSAMACLQKNRDVICFWNGRHFKINFPTQTFPSEIQVYRPPVALNNASIAKIACDEGSGTFAALSVNGEIFTFSMAAPGISSTGNSDSGMHEKANVKPQRVWALRKQFSAVKDVALGSDGSIILCTESGHVYVRTRNAKVGQSTNAKAFKFQRIPYIQRVVEVSANPTGALGALRADCRLEPIAIIGNTLSQDLFEVQPYLSNNNGEVSVLSTVGPPSALEIHSPIEVDADDESEDVSIQEDIVLLIRLVAILQRKEHTSPDIERTPAHPRMAHGADIIVQVGTAQVPCHCVILASRSVALKNVLLGGVVVDGKLKISPILPPGDIIRKPGSHVQLASFRESIPRIVFSGVHPLSVLILLAYLYSDSVLMPWDRRIESAIEAQLTDLKLNARTIKAELVTLSKALHLPHLRTSAEAHFKRITTVSLASDLRALFANTQRESSTSCNIAMIRIDPTAADVILKLADKTVLCHSAILRARSSFFAGLFDDEDWTRNRWRPDRTIEINMQHMRWRVFEFVVRFLYEDGGEELFDVLEFTRSVDDVIEFMFDVIAVASELLLDRLTLVCSSIILRYINITNVCSILSDATHFHASQLIFSLQGYMARNMEALIESRMLDDLSPSLIKQLSAFIRTKQVEKSPYSRSHKLVEELLIKHADWLTLQDIPQPVVPRTPRAIHRRSPKVSPIAPLSSARAGKPVSLAPLPSPPRVEMAQVPVARRTDNVVNGSGLGDEIFQMDDDEHDIIPSSNPITLSATILPEARPLDTRPWKSSISEGSTKSDLRSIIAEAENLKMRSNTSSGPFPVNRTVSAGFVPGGVPSPSQSLSTISAMPQNDRFRTRMPLNNDGHVHPSSTSEAARGNSSTPWRLPPPPSTPPSPLRTPAPRAINDAPRNTPPSGLSRIMQENSGYSASASPTNASLVQTPGKQDAKVKKPDSLGPTYSPRRPSLTPSASISRRSSELTAAWTAAPSTPPELDPGGPSSPPSFLAIQHQQLQGKAPTKPKKSLREIQEEEQARQQEEDFLKWWTAEEQRIKSETQSSPVVQGVQEGGGGGKKSRHPRKKPPFKGSMPASTSKEAGGTDSMTPGPAEHIASANKSKRSRVRPAKPHTQHL